MLNTIIFERILARFLNFQTKGSNIKSLQTGADIQLGNSSISLLAADPDVFNKSGRFCAIQYFFENEKICTQILNLNYSVRIIYLFTERL